MFTGGSVYNICPPVHLIACEKPGSQLLGSASSPCHASQPSVSVPYLDTLNCKCSFYSNLAMFNKGGPSGTHGSVDTRLRARTHLRTCARRAPSGVEAAHNLCVHNSEGRERLCRSGEPRHQPLIQSPVSAEKPILVIKREDKTRCMSNCC